jgi:hypothetical protein
MSLVWLSGWDPNIDHVWTIATASGGISGFAADKFTVDASTSPPTTA